MSHGTEWNEILSQVGLGSLNWHSHLRQSLSPGGYCFGNVIIHGIRFSVVTSQLHNSSINFGTLLMAKV